MSVSISRQCSPSCKSRLTPITTPWLKIDSTPPNVSYEIDDLEEAWSYTSNFDYIHVMMMTGAFRDWPRFIRQSFEYGTQAKPLELSTTDTESIAR